MVLASGSGTNFQAILDAIHDGSLHASVAALVTNNPSAGAIGRAEKHDIPVHILPNEKQMADDRLFDLLQTIDPDLIVLAGYLRMIPDRLTDRFDKRIINIHPSLLPKYGGKGFYGLRVHEAVLQAGETESGCTVHYVNEEYDAGDIVAQARVPVADDDTPETLAKKVLRQEHILLPKVIATLLTKKT